MRRIIMSFVLSIIATIGLTVYAWADSLTETVQDPISYVDERGIMQEPITDYGSINVGTTNLDKTWVIANESITNVNRLTVNGEVNLILCDGVTLKLPKGIAVTKGNSLTIYGQSAGTGTVIISKPENPDAGIGGNWNAPCGTVCICGGVIKTNGAAGAAGIGGGGGRRTNYGGDASGGTIIIKGGMITASGGDGLGGAGGAGIGGGYRGAGGVINISGGIISADGALGAAGIGGGNFSSGGKITISGGTINTRGNGTGAGIGGGIEGDGGLINITGGSVKAIDSGTGSSIGAGSDAEGGNINITGGKVVAESIGSSEYGEDEAMITLGWTGQDDYIEATKYRGTVSIIDGKHLMDESDPSKHFEGAVVDRKLLSNSILVPDLRDYYQIVIASPEHGNLAANHLSALEGDKITLIATPDTGYELLSITIVDATGMTIDYSEMQFVMPANNVTVRVAFAKTEISGSWGDNITWTLDEEGLLSINGIGEMLDFSFESDDAWMHYKGEIMRAVISDGITNISKCAFNNCGNLSAVDLPKTLKSIGEGAFLNCRDLASVHYNGPLALWNKMNIGANNDSLINAELHYLLPDFILPASIREIEEEAFSGGKFTFVQLPDNGLSIGSNTFANCQNLEYVIIPASVSDIDNSVFDTGVTIIGVSGSPVSIYAQENNYIFIPIE